MLTIKSADGQDFVTVPPTLTVYSVEGVDKKFNVNLECFLFQEADYLIKNINGTVYWDDGTPPVTYAGIGTIAIDADRMLGPGSYNVRVEASDYSVPTPGRISVNFPYSVRVAGSEKPKRIVYGPILPKDNGFPNPEQWNFNTGSDVEILASSVKMLLTTNKGERVMLPGYGCNIRVILFEFDSQGIEVLVQNEIISALTAWEPRVLLQYLSVQKTAEREYTVTATFASKLNQQPFTLTLNYT